MDAVWIEQYRRDGYVVVPGLFNAEETRMYRDHFMTFRPEKPSDSDPRNQNLYEGDPLKLYSRLMMPHRTDETSFNWLIEPRINHWLTALLGSEPYAVQTMVYYKPAGARGQALHQDQFYLRVNPGTCMAAWMALDDCDEENGCLQVVPGTQDIPVLCSKEADMEESFTGDTVDLPEGMTPVPVLMKAGDVLFFNGQLVHGSYANTSQGRFRRALIGHYIVGEAERVAQWYHPVLRMDGSEVEFGVSQWGGRCGVWVDQDGQPVAELVGTETRQRFTE
ncbi:MAG: phytanoyl-CoA dioxygenase family protein [Anaerolineae bacterium]|nr:phytanoyl-CoA dioxygenase family protein [Anaerolineae bacterium]